MNGSNQAKMGLALGTIWVLGMFILVMVERLPTAGAGQTPSSPSPLNRTVQNLRRDYFKWRWRCEIKRGDKLVREADILLKSDGSSWVWVRPKGGDFHCLRRAYKDALIRLIPPEHVCGRNLGVIIVPSEWAAGDFPGTANTGLEGHVLRVAKNVKAHGFRRVAVVMKSYGMTLRIFDGENPSARAIDAQLHKIEMLDYGMQ